MFCINRKLAALNETVCCTCAVCDAKLNPAGSTMRSCVTYEYQVQYSTGAKGPHDSTSGATHRLLLDPPWLARLPRTAKAAALAISSAAGGSST